MALERETEFFDEHRHQWIEEGHEGEWAVVYGDRLLGFYPTLSQGFATGAAEFHGDEFLVKQVTPG